MPTLETDSTPITWTVYYKTNWADAWSTDEWLMPESVQFCLAPKIPVATIVRDFGIIHKLGIGSVASSKTTVTPLDLTGKYIKILLQQEVSGSTLSKAWYGYCPAPVDDYQGQRTVDAADVNTGRTTYNCYGLEWLLKDTLITESSVDIALGAGNTESVIPYNFISRKRQWELIGNRGNSTHDSVYHHSNEDTNEWTGLTVLQHLLYHWNIQTGQYIDWDISGGAELVNVLNAWDFEGSDYYSAISSIVNPATGWIWYVDVDEAGTGNARINIMAAVEDDIEDESSSVIVTGQGASITLDIATATDVTRCLIKNIENATYDQVEVRGQRARVCFTVALNSGIWADAMLDEGWTSAQETSYKAATDKVRALDNLASVYTRFTMPADWNGEANGNIALLVIDPLTGKFNTTPALATTYLKNKVFDRALPWPEIDNASKLRRPFAIFQDADNKWHMVERPRKDTDDTTDLSPVSLLMLDDQLGIQINTGSKLNHIIAKNSFSETSDDDPEWDYLTLLATVSMYTDEVTRVLLSTTGGESGQNTRTKVIEMPWCELWYIVPGTVKTIDPTVAGSGGLTTQTGLYTRDDSPKLRRAAYLAKAWYGKPRQIMDLTIGAPWISSSINLGEIINDLTSGEVTEEINTILSELTYEFREKEQLLHLRTSFRDLDIARMMRPAAARGGSGPARFSPSPMHDELASLPVRQGAAAGGAAASIWKAKITGYTSGTDTHTVALYGNGYGQAATQTGLNLDSIDNLAANEELPVNTKLTVMLQGTEYIGSTNGIA